MAPTPDPPTATRWVAIAPGKGTALVGPRVVALLRARPDDAVVDDLWPTIRDGRPFDQALAALGDHGFGRLPDLALAGRDEGMTRVVVRGDVVVEMRAADGAAITEVAGGAVHSWAEHLAPPDVALRLRLSTEGDGREPPGPFVVERGLVAAEAIDVPPAGADVDASRTPAPAPVVADPEPEVASEPEGAPEPVVAPEPDATPAPVVVAPGPASEEVDDHYDHMWGATQFRSVEGAARRPDEDGKPVADTPEAPPTRQIAVPDADHDGRTIIGEELRRLLGTARGRAPDAVGSAAAKEGTYFAVRCPGGHLNPVHGMRCRACGQPLAGDDPEIVDQPELGWFRFSTGEEVVVDRPLLIGRSPKLAGEVRGVLPGLVTVPSPGNDISRTHLEVRVEGWQVLLLDRGSTNGTTVSLPGRTPQRLRPDVPFPLPIGAVVDMADEVEFTFEVDR